MEKFENIVAKTARWELDKLIYKERKSKRDFEHMRRILRWFSRYALGQRTGLVIHKLAQELGLQQEWRETL